MTITNTKAQWNSGNLLISDLTATPSPLYQVRKRFTAAEINAGATILAAVPGVAYRMVNASMIAYGNNVAGPTTTDIQGVQATSTVSLAAFATANLTRSTEVRAGDTGGAILADGASYAVCDVNTAITIATVGGSAFATATGADVILEFGMEHA